MTKLYSMKRFNVIQFIKDFSALNHRQGAQETKAALMLLGILDEYGVKYKTEKFITYIPHFKKATLVADGKNIPAIPTSFVSGEIEGKYNMISSLISSQRFISDSNINFNPHCRVISRSNHYFAPSLAVAPEDLDTICKADHVKGKVEVDKVRHQSMNILVGNKKNPKHVVFAHYDSIGPGAIDDASGIALLLYMVIHHPETLDDVLYIFAGNEELSYDYPLYWGYGYRVFEKKHLSILVRAKSIMAIDCVGHASAIMYTDPGMVRLGLPLKHLDRWMKKTTMLSGGIHELMEVYHSDADTPKRIKKKYMDDAIAMFKKHIR